MSKVAVKGNTLGNAVFTIESPPTDSDRTFVLPDNEGTIITTADIGTIASQDSDNVSISGGTIGGITDLAVEDGGTGASNDSDARVNLGLGDVDNVSAADLRDRSTHTGTQDATTVDYDNASSGLAATDVQAAIDEVDGAVYTDSDALDLFNATGSAPVYACRAWVNFDGDGAVSIRGSGNVSSITDRGTGLYTVNFATDMPDSTYTVGMSTLTSSTTNFTAANAMIEGGGTAGYNSPNIRTASALGLAHASIESGDKQDAVEMYVSIFR